MAINRAPFNALVDDDGSNTIGTIWNKAQIAGVILNPVDAMFETGLWTPTDQSGAGLIFTGIAARYARLGPLMAIVCNMTFPTTSNGAAVSIGGLPYPNRGAVSGFYQNYFSSGIRFFLDVNQTKFAIHNETTGAQKTNAQLSANALMYSGIYLTDP